MTNGKRPTLVEDISPHMPGLQKAQTLGDRIRIVREFRGITQQELSDRIAGRGSDGKQARSSVSQWERNSSAPPVDKVPLIAEVLKVKPSFLAFGMFEDTKIDTEKFGFQLIPEVSFESATSKTEGQKWGIPTAFLRNELNIMNFDDLGIHRVLAAGEDYEYGDRIIVDFGAKKPSPAGHFLYWDGYATNVARMTLVPGPKPVVKVSAGDSSFEAAPDKLGILGRVKGVWKKA